MNSNEEVMTKQFLAFRLAGEEYAIPVLNVREIVQYGVVTCVPNMPASVRGIMNLRGSVLPVVDLGQKLGQPETPPGKHTCIIVVELSGENQVLGVIADSVSEVIELAASEIGPPPPLASGPKMRYLAGLGKVGDRFVLVLDVARALSVEELLAMAECVDHVSEPPDATAAAAAN